MKQSRRFEKRVCLVTGGGRGIGRAVALALSAEGGRVGITARTSAQCQAVADEIGAEQAVALPADVTETSACQRVVSELTDRFGRPSVLVNAAGISPVWQRAEAHDIEAWRATIDVNLTGAYLITRAAAASLLEGGGAVVMISSVLGTIGSPRLAAYGAAKAGLIQLTRTLAREWADREVRVNAVCPGYVETELTSEFLQVERLRADILERTPLGRLASMDEIVAPTLFLASDEASYVTGATLVVDGGTAA